MNKESSNMAALLLLLCIVPAAASAVITKPHFKTEKVYLYHKSPCPEGTLVQAHTIDGKVSCILQQKPHGAAVYKVTLG
jgi:hypothetical protein